MRGIVVREELTEEWKTRGAKEGLEYAILTNEIAKATFGLSVGEHMQLKGLKRQNPRDHMTDLELILNMLGEATATRLHQDRDTQGFENLQEDSREAGEVAGNTRRDIEARTGTSVVSSSNYLHLTQGKKRKSGQLDKGKNNEQPELPEIYE